MLLALLINAVSSPAFALDPRLTISQYGHTAWRTREGFFPGPIVAITQTRDGYIWMATSTDLIRFDGVGFEVWKPPSGSSLLSGIVNIFGATDGALWIAQTTGLQRWHNGKLGTLSNTGRFERFVEDTKGTVWTGNTRVSMPSPPVCRFAQEKFWCVGRGDTVPLKFVTSIYVDGEDVWVGGDGGLCRFTRDQVECFPITALGANDQFGVRSIASDHSGRVIASTGQYGFWQFEFNEWRPLRSPDLSNLRSDNMVSDRERSLWIGTNSRGLLRVTATRTDTFAAADGLSGDNIAALFEDAEGNVWVVTSGGVDRFRDLAVATMTKREGLLEDNVMSITPARNGGVWITGAEAGIVGIDESNVTMLRAGHELPPAHFNSVLEDARGRLWIGTNDGLSWLERGRFVSVRTPDGLPFGVVLAIAEDAQENIWVSTTHPRHALVRVTNGVVSEVFGVEPFGGQVVSMAAAVDGGIWMGVNKPPSGRVGELFRYRASAGSPSSAGTTAGTIRSVLSDEQGVWVGYSAGLLWINSKPGSTAAVLDARNGLPCAGVTAIAKANDSSLWLRASCGLVSISSDELRRWMVDPSVTVRPQVNDIRDGAMGATASPFAPRAARSSDGRLWFVALPFGVQIVDPSRPKQNTRVPPVLVTRLTADRTNYDIAPLVQLPVRTKDLEIHYTALSYRVPELVRFRYMLEGVDADFQDAGVRREAFYMNLQPGRYRFRVVASNDGGVWNEDGAAMEFVIPPAFAQTIWFNILLVGLGVVLLWTVYKMRLRSVTRAIQGRMDERLRERERIARELHDTLLQGTYGLVLRFQAVADQIDHASPVRQSINDALERADKVVAEGRDRVEGLRVAADTPVDLVTAFREAAGDVAAGNHAGLHINVEGTPRAIEPIVRDEVFWVGREAIANAYHAARANRITVVLGFERRGLRLTVRDDGRGIDSDILEAGGRPKHWGIRGMRERIARIGGRLDISSEPNAGTAVEVLIPASLAYVNAPVRWTSWFWPGPPR
jgi:ligand-binding sensor domain-containing protein/signal transduction histidine kinase